MKEKVLISACLLGENVKYNGKNNQIELSILNKLKEKYELIPFCPEVEGGLPTPRPPSEIVSQNPLKIINNQSKDVTSNFMKGAKKTLDLVKKYGIKKAIMKANSPSCSNDKIYDGTFSNTLIKGDGVTVKYLKREGVEVFNEDDVSTLLTSQSSPQ